MSISPVSPVAAALQAQALAAVEGSLIAALTDNASIAARAATATAQPPMASPQTPAAAPAPAPTPSVVDTARAAAATNQAGLAPMFADLAAALNSPNTPPQLRAALVNVLSLRTPVGAAFTGADLQQAVAQSGVMLEAKIAAGAAPGPDLKAALLTLAGGLRNLAPPLPPAPNAERRPLAQNIGVPLDPSRLAPEAQRAARPPPPFRDGGLTGQRVEASTLPAATPAEAAPRLQAEVEQAVARQVLHQIASLPQGPEAQPTWMFELPFLTPQGAMLAQFAIQRDETGHGTEQAAPVWHARFAMEVEPLGPVHVDMRMGGLRSHVTIWAQDDGLAQLSPGSDLLARTLDADVVMRPGAPGDVAPPAPGQFVDRLS